MNAPEIEMSDWIDNAESWKSDHDDAMACQDFERVLSNGLQIFRSLKAQHLGHIARAKRGEKVEASARYDLVRKFELWIRPVPWVQREIELWQYRKHYDLADAAEFALALEWFKANIFDPSELVTACKQIKAGNAVPFRR